MNPSFTSAAHCARPVGLPHGLMQSHTAFIVRGGGALASPTASQPSMAVGPAWSLCPRPPPQEQLHQILGDHSKLRKRGSGIPIGQIHMHISCGGLHALLGPLKRGPSPQLGPQP